MDCNPGISLNINGNVTACVCHGAPRGVNATGEPRGDTGALETLRGVGAGALGAWSGLHIHAPGDSIDRLLGEDL